MKSQSTLDVNDVFDQEKKLQDDKVALTKKYQKETEKKAALLKKEIAELKSKIQSLEDEMSLVDVTKHQTESRSSTPVTIDPKIESRITATLITELRSLSP